VHFVTEVSLYFLNLRKSLRLLIPILCRYLQNNFQPYIVYCSVWPWPTLKWLLEKTNFLSFSLLFLRCTTNLRGTLALVPISTHPNDQSSCPDGLVQPYFGSITFHCFSYISQHHIHMCSILKKVKNDWHVKKLFLCSNMQNHAK
jgi:hypothetical protein